MRFAVIVMIFLAVCTVAGLGVNAYMDAHYPDNEAVCPVDGLSRVEEDDIDLDLVRLSENQWRVVCTIDTNH